VFNLFDHPMVAFTMAFVRTRLEPLRERSERGASALETAIISAVLIAAAVLIGKIVIDKVNGAGETVKNEQIPSAP
jgi:Flp pilus assembly pilin Flp